jgi:hypothetical protein
MERIDMSINGLEAIGFNAGDVNPRFCVEDQMP